MLEQRLIAEEMMDAPDLDADTYRAVVHDLARVNALTMAYRPTLAFLDRAAGARKTLRLLDVGFGDGDMLRRIERWAEKARTCRWSWSAWTSTNAAWPLPAMRRGRIA